MTPDLSEDLKSVIDQYLEGHRSRSLATLSRVSGVAYTTLRRFAQKEGHPTAEPVLKILEATLNTNDKIAFLEQHFPEIARSIKKYATRAASTEAPPSEDLRIMLRRMPHNLIFNLAMNVHGTTRDVILRLCGERGLEALDELVECELVDCDPRTGRVTNQSKVMLSLDSDYLLSQIRHSVELFDRSLIGTKVARLAHGTAGLNKDGLERVYTILSKALVDIMEVHEDPQFQGEVPYYFGAFMNVFDKKPLREEEM